MGHEDCITFEGPGKHHMNGPTENKDYDRNQQQKTHNKVMIRMNTYQNS